LNIEARTKDKDQTALLIACFYGSKKTVETLLNENYSKCFSSVIVDFMWF